MKKATEAPSALMITILAIAGIAIVIILLILLGGGAMHSNTTVTYTNWEKMIKWS